MFFSERISSAFEVSGFQSQGWRQNRRFDFRLVSEDDGHGMETVVPPVVLQQKPRPHEFGDLEPAPLAHHGDVPGVGGSLGKGCGQPAFELLHLLVLVEPQPPAVAEPLHPGGINCRRKGRFDRRSLYEAALILDPQVPGFFETQVVAVDDRNPDLADGRAEGHQIPGDATLVRSPENLDSFEGSQLETCATVRREVGDGRDKGLRDGACLKGLRNVDGAFTQISEGFGGGPAPVSNGTADLMQTQVGHQACLLYTSDAADEVVPV